MPREDVKADIAHISTQLDIQPVIVDAADGGIDGSGGHPWTGNTCNRSWYTTPHGLVSGWTASRMADSQPLAATLQPAITTTTHSAPPVLQNQGLFHCLTTPAPDATGRPPPTRTNEKPDTMARWQADHRAVAVPGQVSGHIATRDHQPRASILARTDDGILRLTRRQYDTRPHRVPPQQGIGQHWHVPTALPVTAVSYTPIQRATAIWLANPVHFGPPPRPTPHLYMPQFSWRDHLQWARTLDNSHTPKALDPTLVWCVKSATAFHPINEFRRQAVEEIQQLVEDMEASRTAGDHDCHRTYTTPTPRQRAPLRPLCLHTCSSKYITPKQTSWNAS